MPVCRDHLWGDKVVVSTTTTPVITVPTSNAARPSEIRCESPLKNQRTKEMQ
jgi:hypothetical protein